MALQKTVLLFSVKKMHNKLKEGRKEGRKEGYMKSGEEDYSTAVRI